MSSRYSLNKNKYLLDPEYNHLEMLLSRYKFKEPRNCLAIAIGLKTGARAQEILNLRKNDMNAYDQSLYIKGIKGSNDRELPIPAALFDEIELFARGLGASDPLFDISYHRLRQIWCEYRPVAKKFHCLRHTFAIRLYKKTRDIRLLQVALGHRNIANTMIYADYVYSQTELRRLIL
jgi:integrase/recombinase XerC